MPAKAAHAITTRRVGRPPADVLDRLIDELEQVTSTIARVTRRERRETSPLADLRKAWRRASAEERRRFLGEIEG